MEEILAAKDAEIERLRSQLARVSEYQEGPSGSRDGDELWATLETRLRSSTGESESENDPKSESQVTQPYECVLRGTGALGFQLAKSFVSVQKDDTDAAASLSKLFGSSSLAAPFVIQERAVVVNVKAGGVAEEAGVIIGSSLRAINGVSVDTMNYATILATIRSAMRPLRLLFTPREAPRFVTGEAYCNPDTVVLDYREATPHSLAAAHRLCDVSSQLGTYLNQVEHSASGVVDQGYAFLNALKHFGRSVSSSGGESREHRSSNADERNQRSARTQSGSLASSVRSLAAKTARTAGDLASAGPSRRRTFFSGLTSTRQMDAQPTTLSSSLETRSELSSESASSNRAPTSASSSSSPSLQTRCLYSNSLPTLGDISVATRSLRRVMDEFCAHLEPFLATLQSGVINSTKDFKSTALLRVKHLKSALKTAQAAHETALNKCAGIKPSLDAASVRAREAEAAVALLNYELVRFELTRALNYVESRKKVHVLNNVTDTILSLHGFLKGAGASLNEEIPLLRELKHAMYEITQSALEKDDASWRNRRVQLEQSLRQNVEQVGSVAFADRQLENNKTTNETVSNAATPGVGALSVVSQQAAKHSSGTDLESNPSSPKIEGYLFTPAGIFGGGWRRVWHFVQNGKLFAYPKPLSLDPFLVADLLVSQVKSSTESSNIRYAFELRTPASRSAIVLQACSSADRSRWIKAITSGVEEALHKQSAIATALSRKSHIDKMDDAMTPETFLLQACKAEVIEVQRSSSVTVKKQSTEPGSYLVWQFSAKGDPSAKIRFIVKRQPTPEEASNIKSTSNDKGSETADNSLLLEMRQTAVHCDGKLHQGKMLLPFSPCPVELVFDNTQSMLYSRTVTVKVEVVAGGMMDAALVAARDDFTRLEKEAEAVRAEKERIAQTTLKSDEVVRRLRMSGESPQKNTITGIKHWGNGFCADCSAPDPDWVSINLGITICIKCSGVHRSLGSHISKVRSMQLDVWTDELVRVIELVGNSRARGVWESEVTGEWKNCVKHLKEFNGKDSFEGDDKGSDSAKLRRDWIRSKYSECAFIAKSEKRRVSDASLLALGSVVTGLCVAGKWEKLLHCLDNANQPTRGNDADADEEDAVDLESAAPWTALYLNRSNSE